MLLQYSGARIQYLNQAIRVRMATYMGMHACAWLTWPGHPAGRPQPGSHAPCHARTAAAPVLFFLTPTTPAAPARRRQQRRHNRAGLSLPVSLPPWREAAAGRGSQAQESERVRRRSAADPKEGWGLQPS
jgi:hypothetical protein